MLRSDLKERGDKLRSGRDNVKLREMRKKTGRDGADNMGSDYDDNMFPGYLSHGNSNLSIIQSGYSTRALADLLRRRYCSVGNTNPRCKNCANNKSYTLFHNYQINSTLIYTTKCVEATKGGQNSPRI